MDDRPAVAASARDPEIRRWLGRPDPAAPDFDAVGAVVRFGFGGLGLHRITYLHAEPNHASASVAAALGFVPEGRLCEAWTVDGARVDVLVLCRLATDPVA